jgi:hypothetical protein
VVSGPRLKKGCGSGKAKAVEAGRGPEASRGGTDGEWTSCGDVDGAMPAEGPDSPVA